MPNSIHSIQHNSSPSLFDFLLFNNSNLLCVCVCLCGLFKLYTKVYFSTSQRYIISFNSCTSSLVLVLIISYANASFNRSNDNLIVRCRICLCQKEVNKEKRAEEQTREKSTVNSLLGTITFPQRVPKSNNWRLPLPDTLLSIDNGAEQRVQR